VLLKSAIAPRLLASEARAKRIEQVSRAEYCLRMN
jgi:hypothetical protein